MEMNLLRKPLLFFFGAACFALSQHSLHSPGSPETESPRDNAITLTKAVCRTIPNQTDADVPAAEPTAGPFVPVSEEQAKEIRKQHWKYAEGKHLLELKPWNEWWGFVMPHSCIDVAIIPSGKYYSQKVIVASNVYVCQVDVQCSCGRDPKEPLPITITLAATPEQAQRLRKITQGTAVPIVLPDKWYVE